MSSARILAVALGVVQMLAWGTTYYLPAIVNGPVAADLHLSRTLVVGAFSWSLIVSGLCSPLVGRWVDRSGGRPVLLSGTVVQAAGLALLATVHSLAAWFGVWTLLGVGMALGLYDAAFATAGRQLGEAARPAIIGITLLGGFASTLGWPLGSFLFARFGWRETALAYAALQLAVNLPLILAVVPRTPPPHAAPKREAATGPLRARRNFRLLAAFFTIRACVTGVVAVYVLTLLRGLGLGPVEAVTAAALIGPGQVGARLLEWAFGRRLTPLATSWAGALLLPLGALLPLAGAPGAVFTATYGMSNGVLTISRGTLPMHLLGPRGYASVIGRLAMPVLLAQAAAPTLVAPLVGHFPAADLLIGIAVVGGLASLCLLPLRPAD